MSFEDLDPRPQRGAMLTALGREDLDLLFGRVEYHAAHRRTQSVGGGPLDRAV